jgi:hypothetical protein
MTAGSGRIILRYFDGCPNWKIAHSRLTEALQKQGMAGDVRLERVETPHEADRLGFRGSPTILINGVDPFADRNAPTGLSCRVYRTDAGMEGSPSIGQLLAALEDPRW